MDLQRVFHYSLGPLPWALATPDGQLAKTSKSTLLDALEKDCQPAERVPRGAAWIVDAMAILQSMSSPPPTFAQLAEQVFLVTCKPFADGSRRVDFVADTYPVISIKGAERSQHAAAGGLLWTISRGSQKCPTQFKSFLSVGANKTSLVQFFLAEWSTNANVYAPKLHNRFLVVTCGEACIFLTSCDGFSIVKMSIPELCSTHEEADTRLLLHAAHASRQGFANVVIRSPDTDVAVLALSFSADIAAHLFFSHRSEKQNPCF